MHENFHIFLNLWACHRFKVRIYFRLKICKVLMGGGGGTVKKVMKKWNEVY